MSTQSTKPVAPKKSFTDTNANSFSDKVLRWEMLEAKLAPLLESMPHVKPVYDQLVQLIATAKSHEFELKSARANAKQGAANRKAMIRTGDGIRSRLSSALAFEHGATSEIMAEFGIRPRKPGGRKKKGTTPTPTPPPTEAQGGTHSTAPAGGGEGTVK